jgi:hypothetical protein
VLVLDMIEILPPLRKYKYDTWRILLVKFYIDNSMRLQSCIRNVNIYTSIVYFLPINFACLCCLLNPDQQSRTRDRASHAATTLLNSVLALRRCHLSPARPSWPCLYCLARIGLGATCRPVDHHHYQEKASSPQRHTL